MIPRICFLFFAGDSDLDRITTNNNSGT